MKRGSTKGTTGFPDSIRSRTSPTGTNTENERSVFSSRIVAF